jgi:hypothetical protein
VFRWTLVSDCGAVLGKNAVFPYNEGMDADRKIELAIRELAQELRGRSDAARLLRRLFDGLCETLLADSATDHIYAPNAVIEVVDTRSGALYRRYLELAYDENDNGIRLMGESMTGGPSQIVFLSDTALKKMRSLKGEDFDDPPCKGKAD